ncbi:hypothetical protein CYMTET_47301 [Cymbomonas tetramitiformis]|uniref:Uncharacterized protein n=1 Tax=Cymbomonas tetramitiformis TaxID=36881 RepID=A0AAE0BUJ4_9CHLO|nr:hypothetical protein CYMTET_47301 [Cymbomonas tetramitiformis]
MDFIRQVCDQANFIYDPVTAISEGRLRFSIGARSKRVGRKETKQEFFLVAHYRPEKHGEDAPEPTERTLEEPVVCYGNTVNLMTAWRSEIYRANESGSNESIIPPRKMTFFTDSSPAQSELVVLYEEMYIKPISEAWHITSPVDYCNRVLTMLEMDSIEVSEDEKEDVEKLKSKLSAKQLEVLQKSIMSYIRSSAYSFERTEKTGKLDATFARRKNDDMGIIATLPVVTGYDTEKKRKYECRDDDTQRLDMGYLEMLDLVSEEPLRVEEHSKEMLHDTLIHSGRDPVTNACLKAHEMIPDRYACVAIKHGGFYFKTETSFAPQKHVRMLVRVPKKERTKMEDGPSVSSIVRGMSGVIKRASSPSVECEEVTESETPDDLA